MRRMLIHLFDLIGLLVLTGGLAGPAWATKYVDTSLESNVCGSTLTSGTFDGVRYSVGSLAEVLALPTVQCLPLTAPSGTHYIEWNVPQEVTCSNPPNCTDPHGLGPDIALPSPLNLVDGTTYYLASYWRFERIGGNDIWTDYGHDFDKLIEIVGTGFRWIVLDGWNGDMRGVPNKFAYSLYVSQAYVPQSCDGIGLEYYSHNVNGYSVANPFYSSYEKWTAVVMGITASGTRGHMSLWVDGKQVISMNCNKTMGSGGVIDRITMGGTIGQPRNMTRPHKRQVDKIMLTDNWQDIVAGGYLAAVPNPPAGLSAPRNLRRD